MGLKRYCFALDLKDDAQLVDKYRAHHKKVWPEIIASIMDSGIVDMEIYLVANRLFMIMDTAPHFSFGAKASADATNAKVQKWERLMWTYQQALPTAPPNSKWQLMERIFKLPEK
ncbi:L-rhamnose mutarotase [Maribacter sp. 2307ULW6-5]|uniref:L-rhamnose mutarotase n=1 Tax=Maribacter sp. 2307ULW6-5 TaxID=3386275 RepID=UPI0039BC25E1